MTTLVLFDTTTTLFLFSWQAMAIRGMILESASLIQKYGSGSTVTTPTTTPVHQDRHYTHQSYIHLESHLFPSEKICFGKIF